MMALKAILHQEFQKCFQQRQRPAQGKYLNDDTSEVCMQ